MNTMTLRNDVILTDLVTPGLVCCLILFVNRRSGTLKKNRLTASGVYRRTYHEMVIGHISIVNVSITLTGSTVARNSKVPTAQPANRGVKLK